MKIAMTKSLISSFVLLLILGCEAGEQFSFLEEAEQVSDTEQTISIVSWTPSDDIIVLTDSSNANLGVATNNSLNAHYTVKLNGTAISDSDSPFYRLYGNVINAGTHSIEFIASNTVSQDTHTFTVRKNTAPDITSSTPASTGNTVTCNGGDLTFEVEASDGDAETLTYTWNINGASGSSYISAVPTGSGSEATFTPDCTLSGSVNVSVDVTDGYETDTSTWGVDVSNPIVAQITDFSPTSDPVVIISSGSQTFSVSAVGKEPITYVWKLDDVVIGGAENAIYDLGAGGLSVGSHTLVVEVSDIDSSDSQSFNIIRNEAPVISGPVPTAISSSMNYQSISNYEVTVTDGNVGQTLTYTWLLDDNTHSSLTNNDDSAIFAPNAGLVGDHTVKVEVSDGYETDDYTWSVNVNYFSSECNNLQSGQVCTFVGNPSIGDNLDPTDDQTLVKIRPTYMLDDGNGNLFISDETNHIIWFYNRSAGDVTVIGMTVEAGKIRAILGNGSNGRNSDGFSNTDFKLWSPQMMAWDSVGGYLYVADYNNHRIVRADSTGAAKRIFGTQNTTNNTSTNTDGDPGTSHQCAQAAGLYLDGTDLYMTCHYRHSIKRADVSDPNDIKGYVVAGYLDGSGATSAGSEDGTAGPAGTARVYNPWGLDMDSDGNLYFTQRADCSVRVIALSGNPLSFFGGAVTVAADEVEHLIGTGVCNTTTGALAGLRIYRPRHVQVHEDSGIKGFYVANTDHHRILYVNNTASSVTIGNREVLSYYGETVFGTGTWAYNGDGDYGSVTNLYAPRGILLSSDLNTLYSSSYNGRVRELDISIDDGLASTTLGQARVRYGFISDADSAPRDVLLYNPTYMVVDDTNETLYYSDSTNRRIRKVNLNTGLIGTAVGKGNGSGNVNNEDPINVYMRDPRGLVLHDNHLLYADQQGGDGANRDCIVRAWNMDPDSGSTLFGQSINADSVHTVAGNITIDGCGVWDSGDDNGPALDARLRHMRELTSDGSNLYIANYDQHCILKLAPDGTISEHIGLCGTAADTEGQLAQDPVIERLRYPMAIAIDPLNAGSGNMFILDKYDQNPSKIKYANFSTSSITIAGTEVPAGYIKTVKVASDRWCMGLATNENQVCYACGRAGYGEYGKHNVTCFDRTDPFGNTTLRVGAPDTSDTQAGAPLGFEQEGINASNALLYAPQGLAFDIAGNLYISDRSSHIIRKVKRWW